MKKQKKIILSSLLALFSLLSVSLLWRYNLVLTGVLILISFLSLWIWRKPKYYRLYITVGISGALAEAIAIYFGAWNYSNPSFINIPLWLPFLWGEVSLYIVSLLLEIEEIRRNK